jgi:hypothetical protein
LGKPFHEGFFFVLPHGQILPIAKRVANTHSQNTRIVPIACISSIGEYSNPLGICQTKKLSIMKYTRGMHVSIEDFSQTTSERHGVCMEDESSSPTERNPNRMVVRVKWEDDGETIENTKDLY